MAVYNIYHKDGSQLKDSNGKGITVHSIEYNGTWMGECFVTVTFENEAPISFSIGDYIEYRGERFEINYDPGKIKCASKDSYGGAFKYDSVKFNALSDELVRCDMLDLVLYDNQLHYTALPQFSFYVESLDDLLDRIQANLDELYGKASWKLYSRNKERSIQRGGLESEWNSVYGEGTADNVIDSTSISISDQTCWDALSLVNSQFDVNFIIRNRNVYVGTAGMPTTNIFKYGKGEGLYEIEQNSESDQMIVTRLRAYGSNRNLPNHYYADLGGIPFLNITGDYHEGSTDNGLSVMMEDSTYAGMFTDIISDNGSNMKHCRIRGSIGGYEFEGTLELVKKDATKSTTRLIAEGKEVCDAIKAKIDSGIVEVDFLSGANKAKFDGNRINYVSNLPNNMACDRLMLPGFPNKTLKEWWDAQTEEKKAWLNPSGKEHIFSNDIYRPYVDSLNIERIGVRPSSVFFDQDDKVNGIVEIYPTIEEMEVDGVRIDEIYSGTNIEDDGRFGDGDTVANVDIYLSPKINFDIRGLMQDDFTIHMKDGMCAGREFKIAGCTKQNDGSWRLTIERQPDDSLNLYFPYNDFQIKKGDHFVLSGIELPDAYVEAASEKLLKYCIAYLDKNDYTRYVYQPKVDEIFMARQHDTAMADASGLTKSLYLTLKEGDIMLFKDDDLGIDAEITIDQLTIKEEDGKIPTYEITLREEKEVGTIQKIQNQISSITNGNGGSLSGATGGGLSSSQIKNLIDAIGSDRFLSKLNPDTAAGIITFLKGTNWGNFTSETGAAMTVDPNTGQTYMEVDRLKVRLKAFFEHLEVQKVGYVGGKIVVSKGQGVDILDVEEIYDSEGNLSAYRCYFLGEQEGRRIDNLLRVDDQMICKDENISEGSTDGATNKYYWRLATAVSSDVVKRGNNVCHWVDLSATDCDTNSDVPSVGDTICQLGNRNDIDRQGAEVLSVVDANSPSFTIYAGINSYSLVNKEYIDMGVINGKAYCNIYGSTYIGDRERKTGYLRWNDDTKTFEIKGTIDITSPLSSGGTIGGAIDNAANAYKGEFDAFTSNVNEVIGGFQAQIDGVIETWFYEPEPTLGNEPAVNWTDNATKDKHLGDLYYSGEGKAYRFQKNGDSYVWQIITDTDITKALEEAKKANDAANAAQGTADSKMKVFVKQPTNSDEYSVGDMWVNATYPADGSIYSNEILKCKEGKAAGAEFTIAHWEKASKYTDDTAAKAAQKTANDAAAAAKDIDDAILAIDNNVDVALKDKIITKTEAAAITEALNSLSAIMADVTKTYAELVNNDVYKLISSDVRTSYKSAYDKLVATFNTLSDYITNTLTKANPITSEILSTYNTHYTNFKTDYEAYVSKLNVVRNSMDALLNTRIGDIATMLGGLKATTDAMDETTQINGGLILSTLLALGYTEGNNFNVMSGVSGLYESDTEKGGGIAFWAGGHRIDINDCTKNADGTYSMGGKVVNPADFLVRHDGTGYAAGGALWWEKDGKVHADPQSFLINEQYVGNVMQLFKFVYSGGTAFENIVHAIPQKPFESLSVGANGLTLYNGENTAKLYIKNGVLFIEGDLAVTGGITMYASDGVKSGMIDQVYAVLDPTIFSKQGDYITIKGDIGGGTVKGATVGGTAVTLDSATGILQFPAYPTATNKAATLAWNTTSTIATVAGTDITVKLPANPNTDTKNTAGSTDTSSKIFLIGATSQAANPQTYSHDTAYVGTDGCLYSGGTKVSVSGHTHSYLPLAGGTVTGQLKLTYDNDVTTTGTTGTLIIGNTSANNIGFDANEIMARNGNTAATLYLNNEGGLVQIGGGGLGVNGSINANGAITRYYSAASSNPMIALTSNNFDVWLWRINSGTAISTSTSAGYGFGLKYIGKGSGDANNLVLYADNQAGTQVAAMTVSQSGAFTFANTVKATTFSGALSGNATTSTKSSYTRGILGRNTSGGDYGASDDNIVISEWNTNSDNRWYLKAKGYECGVGYAKTATKLTSSAGSATLPIYFSDGKPVACTASSVFSNLSSSSATNLSVTVAGQNRTITNLYARYLSFTGRLSSMNVCYGDGTLRHFLATSTTTTGKPEDDSHILHFSWDNDGGWDGQLSIPTTTTKHVQWRTMGGKDSNGNYIYNGWKTLANITDNVASASKWQTARKITLTGSVTGSVSIDGSGDVSLATTTNHTHSYLPLSGGTISNDLTVNGQSKFKCGCFYESNPTLGALSENTFVINPSNSSGNRVGYGLYIWNDYYDGTAKLQSGYEEGDTNALGLALQPLGGNVGIGYSGDVRSLGYILSVNGSINGTSVYYNGNACIHAGNIGSQSVNYATNSTYLYASDSPYRYGDSSPYYMKMRYNVNNDGRWYLSVYPETPKYVAVDYSYTSGNASTATKLQTARTIWGQSFDGTGDIATSQYAKMSYVVFKNYNDDNDAGYCGRGASSSNHIYLTAYSGNSVGIGANNTDNVLYINTSLNVGIGTTSPSEKLHVAGNILVTGGITMYSDLRKKNILSNEVLSLKEIAAAPLFRHTYKSDDNQYIHVGTSAQYWSGIHEDWFTRKDSEGYYQMELQNLGVAMGISLAREIVTFEGAFKKYESKTDKKIRLMKKKINDLEAANKALDARIKELEGSREERRTA